MINPEVTVALKATLDDAWEQRASINIKNADDKTKDAIDSTLSLLAAGSLRAAEKINGAWVTNAWVKKAILLSFITKPNKQIAGAPGGNYWWDKVDAKFNAWGEKDFQAAGFRAVPNCIVRHAAFIARDVILMPCFVNIGAYVDQASMIDTWATVGSCAQIGKRVHISGGTGIGGVLEPLQASPVIIEDDCFIGARSEIAEGVIIEKGSVISMGVFIGQSTRIINRATGEIFFGRVPPYSVVVPGTIPSEKTLPNGKPAPSLACAVIVKTVDEKTKAKTATNDILREAIKNV